MLSRVQRSNVKPRELGVAFKDLRVRGLGTAANFQPTVGSTLNPLLIPEKIRTVLHPPIRDILSGFEGVVNPGEMLRKFIVACVITGGNTCVCSGLGSSWCRMFDTFEGTVEPT